MQAWPKLRTAPAEGSVLTPRYKYAAVIAGLILSFVTGRFLSPAKVETRTEYKAQDHYLANATEIARLEERLKQVTDRNTALEAQTHKRTRTVITPDRIETETIEDARTVITEREIVTVEKIVTATVVQIVEVERKTEIEGSSERVETSLPSWSFGATAGVDVTDFSLEQPLIVGADVGHRLFLGVWVRAWGMSNGTAGLGLRVDL